MSLNKAISALVLAGALCLSTAAQAGNASVIWGTGGPSADPGLRSANLHFMSGQIAEQVARSRSWNQSITSCGVCIYYQITGNYNSISGNSTTSSNFGDVQSDGQFDNDYYFGWMW